MKNFTDLEKASDKPLFTPGPLTTSRTIKQAMLRDVGSRDEAFIETVRFIRESLLELAGVSKADYEAILMQGSGTFGIEAVISSITPPEGRWLFIINGAYGHRMAKIASIHGFAVITLEFPENRKADAEIVWEKLQQEKDVTHVGIVHCETTTGIVNPVEEIGKMAKQQNRIYFVDAMSSFGAVKLDLLNGGIDFLVSSANKCIEGVPGFSFVLAQRAALLASKGNARTLSLDLLDQWRGLEKNGQFRFTPPTHSLLAFAQALRELKAEGGIEGRAARYQYNYETLIRGMRELGFVEYLQPENQSNIITSFKYPEQTNFNFDEFYRRLSDAGFIIYPGKVSKTDCFRIGTIGRIFEADVRNLLMAIRQTLIEMKIEMPLKMKRKA